MTPPDEADDRSLGQEKPHDALHRAAERLHQSDVTPALESQPGHGGEHAERGQQENQKHRCQQETANALEQAALRRGQLAHRQNV